jgi:hypothetical protein
VSALTRRHAASVGAVLGLALALGACASVPRPPVLDESARVARNPALEPERQWAPQAFAHAAQLQVQAEDAFDEGKSEQSAALAEHALAAYQGAVALARLAKAEQRVASAQQKLTLMRQERDELRTSQRDVAAQADALELEYKVVRDQEPLEPITAALPGREAARRSLALSITEQARLLCIAARLTDPKLELTAQERALDELERVLQGSPSPTPVNQAVELRSACLRALSEQRRRHALSAPAQDPSDVLLAELSRALPETPPFRDDRGVVVTLADAFDAKGPRAKVLDALTTLTQVARANPEFAVLVVTHDSRSRTLAAAAKAPLERWRLDSALPRLALHHAGDRLPAVIAPIKGAPPTDPRLEFVFVAP